MPHRTGKQIRDRFINYFDTKYERGKFTKEEDNKIIYYYKIYGNSWAKIAKKIKTRTGDMVKNRFYSSLKNKINNNNNINLLRIKRKRITSKFRTNPIKNNNKKIKAKGEPIGIDNKITDKNDSKKYDNIALNNFNIVTDLVLTIISNPSLFFLKTRSVRLGSRSQIYQPLYQRVLQL